MSNPLHGAEIESGQRVHLDPGQVRSVKPASLALRFGFGALVSVIAGMIGIYLGRKVGGLFLAFPAILPASLTLIAKKEGKEEAEIDSLGATMGGVGMIVFATIAAGGLITFGPGPALLAALLGWIVVATGLYLIVTRLVRRGRAGRHAEAS